MPIQEATKGLPCGDVRGNLRRPLAIADFTKVCRDAVPVEVTEGRVVTGGGLIVARRFVDGFAESPRSYPPWRGFQPGEQVGLVSIQSLTDLPKMPKSTSDDRLDWNRQGQASVPFNLGIKARGKSTGGGVDRLFIDVSCSNLSRSHQVAVPPQRTPQAP